MAELKTQRTAASVPDLLSAIEDAAKRKDAQDLSNLMQDVVGEPPAMWGGALVGFGHRWLKYDSGRELTG